MRTPLDRLRHTLLFELLAILIAAPVAHWVTGESAITVGGLTLALSLLAMGWNYLYNWGFDHWEQRKNWPRPRPLKVRLLHAVGFEAVLLLVGIVIIALWLRVSLWQAFMLDLGFMLFFLFYALVFNWAYDKVFPLLPSAAAA
ncbi:MAG: PACE efflux transporter [Candidatus Thiodiazotropha sp.]